MNRCKECDGELKITGTGYYGDTVEVECQNPDCGECYELEPDGLGLGGDEFVMAAAIEHDLI